MSNVDTKQHVQTVTMTWQQSGQPRPYADSIYEATLEFDQSAPWTDKWTPPEVMVIQMARGLMNRGNFKLKDEERAWHETYAEKVEKLAPNKWRIKLIQPYCD